MLLGSTIAILEILTSVLIDYIYPLISFSHFFRLSCTSAHHILPSSCLMRQKKVVALDLLFHPKTLQMRLI